MAKPIDNVFWRFIIVGLVCFVLGAAAAMLASPLLPRSESYALPPCPLLGSAGFTQMPPEIAAAAGAYEAVRETLARGSLDGLSAQADVITRAFATDNPQISSCAKKLAGATDIESARRAFLRLHQLMEKHAQR